MDESVRHGLVRAGWTAEQIENAEKRDAARRGLLAEAEEAAAALARSDRADLHTHASYIRDCASGLRRAEASSRLRHDGCSPDEWESRLRLAMRLAREDA